MVSRLEESLDGPRGGRSGNAWRFVRFGPAVVLIIAALAKAANFTQILASGGMLSSRPTLLFVVALEAAVAAFVVIAGGIWSWRAVVATFAVFAATSVYALNSREACNCFGEWFSAEVVLSLDILVLIAAIAFRPGSRTATPLGYRWIAPTLLIGLGLSLSVYIGDQYRLNEIAKNGAISFLLADDLRGQRWPLEETYHPALKELQNGKWLVIVARPNCEFCHKLINTHFDDPKFHRQGERTALFVAGEDRWAFKFDHMSLHMESSDMIEWPSGGPFVASPAVFLLEDGIVIDARDGAEAETVFGELSVFAHM